jgi:hypothetical protein
MVPVNNPLTDGQSNTGPGIFIAGMKTLEEPKDVLLIFRVYADAVVAHAE